MIISQDYCTGALTKVPEILACGIPLILNQGAARSYRRFPGVEVFNSTSELQGHLEHLPSVPPSFEAPDRRYNQFLDSIM
jgi:hypothetical protein